MRTVEKVAALLERLGERGEAGVSDLARHIGADKGAVHRILRALREVEWVEQNPQNRLYSIGPALEALSESQPSRSDLIAAASPVLDALVEVVDETSLFTGRRGAFNVVDLVRESTKDMRVVVEVGRHVPLHAGAAGKVLLAFERPLLRERLLEREMEALAHRATTDPECLREELELIRERGWGYDDGEYSPGACGLAAPVFNRRRAVVGCICVRAPSSRLSFEQARQYAPLVIAAADKVAAAVGQTG